jgi:ankyrin repeat protein
MIGPLNAVSSFDWNREQYTQGVVTKMLHISSKEDMGQVVTLLLARPDIEVNKTDTDGWTALHGVAFYGYTALVTLLLPRPDFDVNEADTDGRRALHRPASCGHTAVVTLLIARTDVNVTKENIDGLTALYWAAFYGHATMATLLEGHTRSSMKSAYHPSHHGPCFIFIYFIISDQ